MKPKPYAKLRSIFTRFWNELNAVLLISSQLERSIKVIVLLVVVVSLFLFAPIECTAAERPASPLLEVNDRAVVSEADLIYLSPATAPLEGQPIGNGRMGTLVWTTPNTLNFQINRSDVFAVNKNAASKREGPTDYCGGSGRVTIDLGGQPFQRADTFKQRLSLYDAECTLTGNQVSVRCFISATKDVMAVEIDDQRDDPQPIRAKLSMWRPPEVKTGDHLARYDWVQQGSAIGVVQRFHEKDHDCVSAVALQAATDDVEVTEPIARAGPTGAPIGNMLSSRFSVSTLTKDQARIPLTISNLQNGSYQLTTYHHDSIKGGVWDSITVNDVTVKNVMTSTGPAPHEVGQADFEFQVTDNSAHVLFTKLTAGGSDGDGDASVCGFALRRIEPSDADNDPPTLLVNLQANGQSDGSVRAAADQSGWEKWTNPNTSPVFVSQTRTFENPVGIDGRVDVTLGPDLDENIEAGTFPQFRNRDPITDSTGHSSRQLDLPAARGIRTILISSADSFKPGADVQEEAFALLKTASAPQEVYRELRRNHTDWWSKFWERTFVHLSSDDGVAQFMNRIRTMHLYYMASTSRGRLPAKWNASLFAVNGDQRYWGAQYWVWTTEISHHPLYAADASDLADPYFNMYVNQLPAARIAAQQRWDAKGAYFLEAGPFDGPVILPDDVAQEWQDVYLGRMGCKEFSVAARAVGQYECVLTQFADGRDCAAGRYSYISHMTSCGSDLAVQAWWRYRYTGDKEFLRTHAYPLLRDTLEFYRSIARKENDGKYHLYGLNQHEGDWGVNDGIIDLGAIRGTAPLAILASEILGVDADMRPKWREFLENLTPYTMGGDPGSQALGGGFSADDVWSVGHLGEVKRGGKPGATLAWPIFTFEDWTLETRDPETDRIVRKIADLDFSRVSIAGGGRMPGTHATLVMGARIGRGEDLPAMMASYYWGSNPAPNGFSEFEGKTAHSIEILGCIATTLQEGLIQSVSARPGQPEVITILPAWPRHWNAAFRLLARGGFLVTTSYRDGQVEFVQLQSRFGEPCRLRNPWDGPCQLVETNGSKDGPSRTLAGDLLTFETAKGRTSRLLPQGAMPPEPRRISPEIAAEPVSYSFELADGNTVGATLGRRRDQ